MPAVAALLLLASAGAAEPQLVDMSRRFGLRAVATVIAARALEDRDAGSIQLDLAAAGLAALKTPVTADGPTGRRLTGLTPATGCFWSYDTRCTFTATAREPVRLGVWDVRCADAKGRGVPAGIQHRIEAAAEAGQRVEVRVWDMASCWRAGGTTLRLVDLTTERAVARAGVGAILARSRDELGPLAVHLPPGIDFDQVAVLVPAPVLTAADTLRVLDATSGITVVGEPIDVEPAPDGPGRHFELELDGEVARLTAHVQRCAAPASTPDGSGIRVQVTVTVALVPASITRVETQIVDVPCD